VFLGPAVRPMLTRRGFSWALLGVGAAAAVAAPAAWVTVDEDAVLLAACEALFPPTDGLPHPRELDLTGNVRRYVRHMPGPVAWQLRGLLRIVELRTIATAGQTFSALPLDARIAFLTGLAHRGTGPDRLIVNALRQVCAMGYWQSPQTWPHLGYDGPLVGRAP
jgi:hypothetical protein